VFSTTDTIVAIATPPGRGGLGVVRVSGPSAQEIAQRLTGRDERFEPRRATLAELRGADGSFDRAIVTVFPGPHSYTGEDVAEVSVHGSPVLLQAAIAESMRLGARLAEPGEFTLRAFLHGRIDLVQAEAIRDLIEAVTPLQARAAFDQLEGTLTAEIREIDAALFDLCARLEASLDFPDEGYHFIDGQSAASEIESVATRIDRLLESARRGRLLREGLQVVLSGRPNTGKSSIFNQLAGSGRAIVTAVPGTTRDLVTEVVDVGGVPVTVVDTAGVRVSPADAIEAEGIARAAAARSVAALVVVVLDGSVPLNDDDRVLLEQTTTVPRVIVANKSDLPASWIALDAKDCVVRVSALQGDGIDNLRSAILAAIVGGGSDARDLPAVTNLRHVDLLTRAREALGRAVAAADSRVPEEFVLADINEARGLLEEITGARTSDDLLGHIFASFCVGK
jgi:tRNA modification GTPase